MKTITRFICTAFAALALGCFALLPGAQATDLDGVLPNGNTADGSGVLVNLTTGIWNSGFGFQALNHDTVGNNNTATGVRALFSDSSGSYNTANGVYALYANTTGWYNNAVGAYALSHNTVASYNTANGYFALYSNTAGGHNTATGYAALFSNTTGGANTANGSRALFYNTTGLNNTAIGYGALHTNTNGRGNTATGTYALRNNSIGKFNIALGNEAGYNLTSDNNIDIASQGMAGESNTIRIGVVVPFTDQQGFVHPAHTATYVAGISGQTAAGGAAVFVNSDGKLGTLTSSARFKTDIKPMDKGSEAILALKPVSFRYKQQIDPKGTPQFGLVAEDVEKVNPDLVVRDAEGKVNTVRYEAVNAMLLNEFLKEHRKNEEQQATIAGLEKQVEALTAGLQRVTAQVEMSRPASQTVLNNQ